MLKKKNNKINTYNPKYTHYMTVFSLQYYTNISMILTKKSQLKALTPDFKLGLRCV